MNVVMSCDKLVVIGKETMMLELWLSRTLAIEKYGIAKLPYKRFWKFLDGSFLQVGERKSGGMAPVRYEFNPNKVSPCDANGIDIVTGVLSSIAFGRFSRVDIAIDYFGVDLGQAKWIQMERSKSTKEYRDAGGRLETLYIGSRESSLMHRIYNKAKERNDKGEQYDGLWWRVEAQCSFGNQQGLHPWYNPFLGLVCVLESENNELAWEDIAKLAYLANHPERFARLDSRTKKKYKEMMVENSKVLSPSPQEVYEKENDQLFAQLATYEGKALKPILVL